jgi:hypothetical protein
MCPFRSGFVPSLEVPWFDNDPGAWMLGESPPAGRLDPRPLSLTQLGVFVMVNRVAAAEHVF